MIDQRKRAIAEARAYLAEIEALDPDTYEAASLRFRIAVAECVVAFLESFGPAYEWLAVLLFRVFGWWVDLRWTFRALRAVLLETVSTLGDAIRGARAEMRGMDELRKATGMDKLKCVELQVLEDGVMQTVRWWCPRETTEAEILDFERRLNAKAAKR